MNPARFALPALALLLPLLPIPASAVASMKKGGGVTEAGPGWTFEFEIPPLPEDLGWLGDRVMEDLRDIRAGFAASAGEEYSAWGTDPSWFDWSFDGSLSILPAPDGFLCARADWWSYTGGAHGNEGSILYRYAVSTGEDGATTWAALSTRDILADSAELAELSRLVVDTLAARLGSDSDEGWILEGAGPEWSNYSLLRPVPDSTGALAGFGIVFESYAVAPYACGPQEVFVPVGLLRP